MANFSGAVKIGDLNDFIAPSQACVVSLNGSKEVAAPEAEAGAVHIQRRTPASFAQAKPAEPSGPVTVSLHDCLACSGCVTSAETVLLQHQSVDELLSKLRDPLVAVVVSLSPQSVASLAAAAGLLPAECASRLATALRRLGARAVFDIAWSRDVALAEAAAEFVARYRRRQQQQQVGSGAVAAAADGMDLDAGPADSSARHGSSTDDDSGAGPLPMLASACPGWVCYAEKTHGDHVLPYISTAKSPQAVMGSLVKRWWAPGQGLQAAQVYHCAVMPCYDKKLEAARDDFRIGGTEVFETDCVLATTELYDLIQAHAPSHSLPDGQQQPAAATAAWPALKGVPPSPLDQPFTVEAPGRARWGVPGGSGGYLEHVFRTAAKELFGVEVPAGPLPMVAGRNTDLRECVLEVGGVPVLRFAAAYGFRNIQGLIRRLKLGKSPYDYVEVMACPSGCLNGGGQLRPAPGETAHQLIERLETLYHSPDSLAVRRPEESPGVVQLYQHVVGGPPGSAPAQALLHTQYHRREKTVAAALADW